MNSKKSGRAERVTVVLSNKLGDSILSLPLILCLRKLGAAFESPEFMIDFISYQPLKEVFESVGAHSVTQMSLGGKIKSWFNPPDRAFFLIASSKNFGFHARTTYGLRQSNKWMTRFDHDLKFLRSEPLPIQLVQYLSTECGLPPFSVRQFGIVLELGYSVEQIISTFSFSSESLPIDNSRLTDEQKIAAPYLICCIEAASGRGKRNDHRRWVAEHYLAIAEKIREQHDLRIAFVGISSDPPVPAADGFLDLRGKLNLWQLFKLAAGAIGYFGNDTGPMHMANLARIPTVGVYPAENDYAPMFGELHTALIAPASPDDVYPSVQRMILAAGIQAEETIR